MNMSMEKIEIDAIENSRMILIDNLLSNQPYNLTIGDLELIDCLICVKKKYKKLYPVSIELIKNVQEFKDKYGYTNLSLNPNKLRRGFYKLVFKDLKKKKVINTILYKNPGNHKDETKYEFTQEFEDTISFPNNIMLLLPTFWEKNDLKQFPESILKKKDKFELFHRFVQLKSMGKNPSFRLLSNSKIDKEVYSHATKLWFDWQIDYVLNIEELNEMIKISPEKYAEKKVKECYRYLCKDYNFQKRFPNFEYYKKFITIKI